MSAIHVSFLTHSDFLVKVQHQDAHSGETKRFFQQMIIVVVYFRLVDG